MSFFSVVSQSSSSSLVKNRIQKSEFRRQEEAGRRLRRRLQDLICVLGFSLQFPLPTGERVGAGD